MKSNVIKYAFILFILLLIGFAAYRIYHTDNIFHDDKHSYVKGEMNPDILPNIRIGISNFDTINPLISQNRDIINLSTILYEPLMTLSSDYRLELALAKECSKLNETTYIVTLKDNLKWEDGTALTGKDIQFTVEKLKNGKSIYSDNVKKIQSVELIDEQTVRFNLGQADSYFEYNLIFPILSSIQFAKAKNFYTSNITPMSSGMYKVKSISDTTVELEQNPNWYQGEDTPRKIETIQIQLYDTMGDCYNSFKIGNIDMLCTSNTKIKEYIGTIGYTAKEYQGRELDFISMNQENSILSHQEVRQAIHYAIDKKKMISSVYDDEYYLSNFPLDYGNYLYTKENTSSYSKEKAKKVLKDSGWLYKNGRWQKTENSTTKTIRLTLVVDRSNSNRVDVAKRIKEQLEDIGIQITLNQVSNANYQKYLKNKDYDMILTGIYNGYSPDLSYFLGENNLANYKNAEIQSILEELQNETEENAIQEKYNKIIEIYEKDVPYICLYRNKTRVIYSMKLIGEFTPNNYSAYYNFEKWYRQ